MTINKFKRYSIVKFSDQSQNDITQFLHRVLIKQSRKIMKCNTCFHLMESVEPVKSLSDFKSYKRNSKSSQKKHLKRCCLLKYRILSLFNLIKCLESKT